MEARSNNSKCEPRKEFPCFSVSVACLLKPNWYLPLTEKLFQLADALFLKVEDRCGQCRVGVTGTEHVCKMLERAGAA